ncbi:MAG: lactate racemase domain-containing protein [Actinomycetota bacterium]|nr:lactate racemase domain-containing protein [Actinomycetota bacterium]
MTETVALATPPGAVAQLGGLTEPLAEEQISAFIREQLASVDLDGRSLCVLVPDGTRSCPLPLLMAAVHRAVHGRVTRLTVVVALGTHAAMTEPALADHLGYPVGGLDGWYPGTMVRNHQWWDPATFADVGTIPADRIAELSRGMLRQKANVRINRAVVDHDVTLIVGPVFPHEVVGFSGGDKYLFPGVSGRELIDLSHWLGALISSAEIIGTRGITPVRALINEAASLVPSERLALCVVTCSGSRFAEPEELAVRTPNKVPHVAETSVELHAMTFGEPQAAWAAAADVAAETHIRYLDAPVRRVLSILPTKYDDLWTGAKGFYKVEPIVADEGQVVIYAPHIREISTTHPHIAEIGYHCRDYFVTQWDRFKDFHWGDLAHSTHLRGAGTYDDVHGERLRVTVTLATGIPEERVRAVNLDYLDPATIDIDAWAADPDTFVVPEAGEDLFRLR